VRLLGAPPGASCSERVCPPTTGKSSIEAPGRNDWVGGWVRGGRVWDAGLHVRFVGSGHGVLDRGVRIHWILCSRSMAGAKAVWP